MSKTRPAIGGLRLGQQIELERAQPVVSEYVGDILIARAVPAAAAAVRERHHGNPASRQTEVSGQVDAVYRDRHVPRGGIVTRIAIAARAESASGSRGAQHSRDFAIGHLVEGIVGGANGRRGAEGTLAHHLVGQAGQPVQGVRRADRRGDDDPSRTTGPGHLAGGAGGRSGGDAVVHDDGDPVSHVDRRRGTTQPVQPAVQFGLLSGLYGADLPVGDAGLPDHILVVDTDAILAQRSHGQLGPGRHAELANRDHVERSREHRSHLGRDRHAAPR